MMGLTDRQDHALQVIRRSFDETGAAPSYREMMRALGLQSTSNVHYIMKCLEERGAIRRLPGRARAVEIVNPTGGGRRGR